MDRSIGQPASWDKPICFRPSKIILSFELGAAKTQKNPSMYASAFSTPFKIAVYTFLPTDMITRHQQTVTQCCFTRGRCLSLSQLSKHDARIVVFHFRELFLETKTVLSMGIIPLV
jgi:hypothetical protein